mmetsp:Transcript_24143/g.83818  ORF Transcript_24143/g.83818 Transcript_24143/m.83818 type:complete len:393 (-) Transcript_24143:1819-2997(-)
MARAHRAHLSLPAAAVAARRTRRLDEAVGPVSQTRNRSLRRRFLREEPVLGVVVNKTLDHAALVTVRVPRLMPLQQGLQVLVRRQRPRVHHIGLPRQQQQNGGEHGEHQRLGRLLRQSLRQQFEVARRQSALQPNALHLLREVRDVEDLGAHADAARCRRFDILNATARLQLLARLGDALTPQSRQPHRQHGGTGAVALLHLAHQVVGQHVNDQRTPLERHLVERLPDETMPEIRVAHVATRLRPRDVGLAVSVALDHVDDTRHHVLDRLRRFLHEAHLLKVVLIDERDDLLGRQAEQPAVQVRLAHHRCVRHLRAALPALLLRGDALARDVAPRSTLDLQRSAVRLDFDLAGGRLLAPGAAARERLDLGAGLVARRQLFFVGHEQRQQLPL